ncbi:MAG: hypothetical protein IMY69_02895 [Bacteroidetes bacterium]|nr:hypothetical protein [Bacteroidota bacterium]
MSFAQGKKIVFIVLLLPAIFGLFFNQATNGHYHKLPNGEIVHHSHPYHHQDNHESPFENHPHSESEYFILALLSNPLTLLCFFLVLTNPIKILYRKIEYQTTETFSTYKYQYPNVYRGPPGF